MPPHLTKDPAAAVNAPVLCYSFAECQQALGYSDDFKTFTLCQSMDACFNAMGICHITFPPLTNLLRFAVQGVIPPGSGLDLLPHLRELVQRDQNRQGFRDALHIVNTILTHYGRNGIVGRRYEVQYPIQWVVPEER